MYCVDVSLARPSSVVQAPHLAIENLWYEYADGVVALRGINCAIDPGEQLAIVGQNGSGKTTLAKHLNGLLRPSRGCVRFDGNDVRGRSVGELAARVGYVFQNPDHQIFAATVWEELAFGPRQLGVAEPEVRERVEEALEFFRLAEYRREPPAALGYGQRREVAVASVLTMRPSVLVLDEPVVGLHWRAVKALLARLEELNRSGHTIILITHNMRVVAEFARRVLVMADGQLLADQSPRELFTSSAVVEAASLDRPQISALGRRLIDCGMSGDSLTATEFRDEYCHLCGSRQRIR